MHGEAGSHSSSSSRSAVLDCIRSASAPFAVVARDRDTESECLSAVHSSPSGAPPLVILQDAVVIAFFLCAHNRVCSPRIASEGCCDALACCVDCCLDYPICICQWLCASSFLACSSTLFTSKACSAALSLLSILRFSRCGRVCVRFLL